MMKRRTTVKAVKLPEAKERHKKMMNNLTTGKALIISEAEKRHKKDVQRIEDTLKTAPDKRKYLELEKDIVFRILKKDIDVLNDTIVLRTKTRYYRTGQFDWELEQIRLIRQHYKNYLRGGNVNYAEETLTPKADNIINAIRFYQLETYLENYKPEVAFEPHKRTLADIALQYFWEGKTITNQNKNEIAALFPELHLINGEKLYQRFNEYRKRGERVFDRGDDRKNIKHLKIMETALKFLSEPEQLHSAEKEILLFKSEVKKVSGQIL